MTRRWWIVLLVLLAPVVQAATVHAFLDRSEVSLGDTVTLNIQSDGSLGNPDLSALQKDFEVLGTSKSSSVQIVNGKTSRTEQLGIALRPLRAGTLTIPALDIGGGTTQALTLQVGAAPSGGSGKTGDPVFMQASVQSSSPWVGQQTVYTVRLYYLPGVDGALGDPSAAGARLVPLDRDHRYTVDRNGYTYMVMERSWALLPQRAGAITVHGPAFQGQQMGSGIPRALLNNPQALLNNPQALLNMPLRGFGNPVRASAPEVRLEARTPPAGAGQPWLPARGMQLRLSGVPADGKVDGSAPLTVTLSISAVGQPADALPEPELPAIPGARVYPDQSQESTDNHGEWLKGTRTRSFAIVPSRNGTLTIPAITLAWWDVESDHAEQASVPAHTLTVSGVTGHAPAAPPAAAPSPNAVAGTATGAPSAAVESAPRTPWRTIALASLAAWIVVMLVAFAWWIARRQAGGGGSHPDAPVADAEGVRSGAAAADAAAPSPKQAKVAPTAAPRDLQEQALDAARAGDAARTEHGLLEWARAVRPTVQHAGALRDALSDPAQRGALDALQRARWQGGDGASACAAVAQAFAHGFAWHDDDKPASGADDEALPPLYPS